MAIVKMNKFTLLTFGSHKEELLRKLQGAFKSRIYQLQDENVLEKMKSLRIFRKIV